MELSDKFTKLLAATLAQYKNALIKLKGEFVKVYLEERIENRVFICNPDEETYYVKKNNPYL